MTMRAESKIQTRMANSLHRFQALVAPAENKRAQRAAIERQTAEFIVRGGCINDLCERPAPCARAST